MAQGGFDLAYGDVNALIELCARRPEVAPRGVYMMFNASPSCVLVAADGPVQHPRQLLLASHGPRRGHRHVELLQHHVAGSLRSTPWMFLRSPPRIAPRGISRLLLLSSLAMSGNSP